MARRYMISGGPVMFGLYAARRMGLLSGVLYYFCMLLRAFFRGLK